MKMLVLLLSGALAGIVVASFLAPPMLSWYTSPGGLPKGAEVQAVVQIPEVVRYVSSRLLWAQTVGGGVGAALGLALSFMTRRKSSVGDPHALISAASIPGDFPMRALFATLTALALAAPALAQNQSAAAQNPEWTRPFPPFRIVGNVYWVGGYDLSTYLITTPAGNILINTGVGDTAKQIAASVTQLGFKMSDTKILTTTHGHIDHAAGLAELKRMTGATVVVSEPEKELLESGGRTDFRFGSTPGMQFEPVHVDRTFKDGEKISLGGTELTAHINAGHTKGATSFTFNVSDGGKTYRVVIANMGSINPGVSMSGMPTYPGIAGDYARTFLAQKDMKIDIWLASHASQFNMHDKYTPGAPYDPNRFVDPAGFLAAVQRLEKTYLDQVELEKKR